MGSFDKCHCGADAGAMFPLLPGSPSFCRSHMPVGHDEPDDFDIPDFTDNLFQQLEDAYDDFSWEAQEIRSRGRRALWETKDERKTQVKDMDDSHVENTLKIILRAKKHGKMHSIWWETVGEAWIQVLSKEVDRRKRKELEVQDLRRSHGNP